MKYDFVNSILHGSAQDKLKELPSDSVDCCITSPPYWALRDYKTEGQLGLEPTFQHYIKKLVDIFSQVRRVLKRSGSCWVNIGDTYSSGGRGKNTTPTNTGNKMAKDCFRYDTGLPDKSLCLIPERFAIAMVDQGWILRNKIIWYKPNCMPSSAKDRFTVDWEYLFFFTKSQRYYFETQYEPIDKDTPKKYESGFTFPRAWANEQIPFRKSAGTINWQLSPLGRIKRCVWKIATQPFAEAHFATFPPALVKTPLLATCPEYICKRCGKARDKIIEPTGNMITDGYGIPREKENINDWSPTSSILTKQRKEYKETGLTDCGCNAGFDGGIVLDPFMGSGTVALVAMQNARNFVGIELSQAYIDMALKRLEPYLLQTRLEIG